MSNQFVLALAGPSGSGKSTVALKLAKQFEKCVDIEIDDVKHFIVTAFTSETSIDGVKKWNYDEWELVGDSVGLLAHNFRTNGYPVIINGYMTELGWEAAKNHVALTHKILLLPQVDETKKRDRKRSGDKPMGEQAVMEHHGYYSNSGYYEDFTRVDTTHHSVEDTVAEVKRLIE